jgi:hypothetical protein
MRRALVWLTAAVIGLLAALPAHAAQIALVPATKGATFVAIQPIATSLGWTFRRTADGAILDDGSGPQALRIGSRNVREDGEEVALFDVPVAERNGQIALAIADAATLFHLEIVRSGANVALVNEPVEDVTIREIPRPATPSPKPVPTARPEAFSTPSIVQGNAGTLGVSVLFDGNSHIIQTSIGGNAGLVHGSVTTYGSDQLGTPMGLVTVGSASRNVSFGSVGNPFAGSVISNGTLIGGDAHVVKDGAAYDAYSGHSINGSIAGIARTRDETTDALASVSNDGTQQFVLRHAVVVPQNWGTFEYEGIAGEHGAAVGISARTHGKIFLDATASQATGNLPLTDGDLPTGAFVGDHLSSATTLTAGYVHSINAPGSPTLGLSTQWNHLALSTVVSKHWTNLSASFGTANAYASFFASAGTQRVFGVTGGLALHRAIADLQFTSNGGPLSGTAQVRTNHPGINLAAGLNVNGGLVRPLVGVVVPMGPALAFEAGLVPGSSGQPALRLSMLAGFRQARPRVPTFPVSVYVPNATQYGRVRLFVDGAPLATPFVTGAHVDVPAGRHTLYAESADRAYASPPQDFIASSTATVDLMLFPQRTIEGTVSFGGAPSAAPQGISLAGIRVVLEPSGESIATDENGHFVFPRGAYDPASTILLDPDSVPNAFVAPGAVPIAAGSTNVTLAPARKVENASFH